MSSDNLMNSDNLMASDNVTTSDILILSNILMASNLINSDNLLASDDLFNSQMINMVQEFYSTTDSTAQQSRDSQQLYTSSGSVPSEQYYLESEEVREYTTLRTRQENESLINTAVHTTAEISEDIFELSLVEDFSELPLVEEISELPLVEEIAELPLVYRGEKQVSKKGSNYVLVYDIPESQLCYSFHYQKKTKRDGHNIYRCTGCQLQNRCYTSIQVHGDTFDRDPCAIAHNCLPLDRYTDKANRVGYQACQKLRRDNKAYKTTPYRHYSETAQAILSNDWKTIEERKKVLGKFYGKSYEQRRKTFSNAANFQKRTVELNNVPDDLRNVPGGGAFMQLETDDLHIYYCKETVEMARDHGLYALVGDGVHNLNPVTIPNRMDKGQLYVLHAAVQGGIEVPILYAVARYKNVETYKSIFGSLREILGDFSDRFILDFEKAAIRAARETFPEAKVQGCAFHLAQSWNRMAVNLGVQKFVRGPKAVLAVKNWWKILKGIAYLPEELINRVTALLAPPVSEAHAAYVPCSDFLKYLNSVYFNGTFKGMWCKWDMRDFRTTNTAEAFHSKLRGMLSRRINPPFEELLECLHAINTVALGSLYHVKENARAGKLLRKRDQERRHKINQAMDEFKNLYHSGESIEASVINNFCRKMSQFVSEKTI